MTLRGLYAITPEEADSAQLEASVRALFASAAAHCAALQYRNKSTDAAFRLEQAKRLAILARASGVPFIVNDDVALALAVDADGVHIGRDDGDIGAARAAVAAGADYVAFGSVFPSTTKPGTVRAPLRLFGQAKALGVPLVAIGGITPQNAGALLQAGADALAVISALFDGADVGARAQEFARLFSTLSTRTGTTA